MDQNLPPRSETATSFGTDDDYVDEPLPLLNRSQTSRARKKTVSHASGFGGDEHLPAHLVPHDKDDEAKEVVCSALMQNRFSSNLDDSQRGIIFESMDYFVFEAGETVVTEGEGGQYFFVVHTGELTVGVNGKIVNTLKRGTAFGGISLLYNCPRTATVTAQVSSGIWGAKGTIFRRVVREQAHKSMAENRQLLNSIHLFEGLPARKKEQVSQLVFLCERFSAGQRVLSEGERASTIYLVKKGKLSVWSGAKFDSSGEVVGGQMVGNLQEGDVFGEQAALYQQPRLATVKAETDTEVLCLNVPQLKSVLGSDLVGCLEQTFVGSKIRSMPVLDRLSPAQQQCILSAVKFNSFTPHQKLENHLQLLVIIDGQVHGVRGNSQATLRRGDWHQDAEFVRMHEDVADIQKEAGLSGLVVGAEGARLATLTKEDFSEALKRLGVAAIGGSQESADYIRKVLLAKRVPLFRELSPDQVDKLVETFVLTRYNQGAEVVRQGEIGTCFFVIANGEVKMVVDGNCIRVLRKNDFFGVRTLLLGGRQFASVQVVSDTAEFWCSDSATFSQVISENMRTELVQSIKIRDTSVNLRSLEHVRLIGAGAFGSVRLVQHKYTKLRYAMKRVRKTDGHAPVEVYKEYELLQSVSHPFILKNVAIFETRRSTYILTELVTGGQLYEQLEKIGLLTRKHAQFYIGSLALVLEALHEANIMYRDLKPENVMLDTKGYVKLVDFGLSKKLDKNAAKTHTLVGTIFYMAPEVILGMTSGHGYGMEADTWSLGVMFFELVCGHLPFGDGDEDDTSIIESILEKKLEFAGRYNDSAGKKLISAMLDRNPSKRIGSRDGWQEVKDHKFFKAGVSGSLFSKILGRELEPPVAPDGEHYSNEKALAEKITLSDADDLGGTRDE